LRPLYETQEHLTGEKSFGEVIQDKWKCVLTKLPIQYGLDFCTYKDNKFSGFIELKNRTCSKKSFDTYIISLSKFLKAKEFFRTTGFPTYLCVKWTDDMGYVRLDKLESIEIKQGGRTDRNDWQDVEPVIHISMEHFNKL